MQRKIRSTVFWILKVDELSRGVASEVISTRPDTHTGYSDQLSTWVFHVPISPKLGIFASSVAYSLSGQRSWRGCDHHRSAGVGIEQQGYPVSLKTLTAMRLNWPFDHLLGQPIRQSGQDAPRMSKARQGWCVELTCSRCVYPDSTVAMNILSLPDNNLECRQKPQSHHGLSPMRCSSYRPTAFYPTSMSRPDAYPVFRPIQV